MYIRIFWWAILVIIVAAQACNNQPKREGATMGEEEGGHSEVVYAVSIDGKVLGKIPEPDSIVRANEERLTSTRNAYLQNLDKEISYLNYAKANLAVGTVENAVQVLTKGLNKFPNSADLYWMRAEALIITRQFNPAIQDLWKAGKVIEAQGPKMGIGELTEQEKRLGENLQYRIYRAMGLAFQHTGDFANAEKMWEIVGDFSNNPDLYCMAYYWQYPAYMRAGREADAKEILKTVTPNMSVMEITRPYLESLLFYKGDIGASELVNASYTPLSSLEARDWLIKMYAIGIKALLEKREGIAAETFKAMVATPYWNQAPYIAAEAELNRLRGIIYKQPEEINLNSKNRRK